MVIKPTKKNVSPKAADNAQNLLEVSGPSDDMDFSKITQNTICKRSDLNDMPPLEDVSD